MGDDGGGGVIDLAAIKARCEAATPGPWAVAGKDEDDHTPWVIALDGDAEPWWVAAWVAAFAMDITPTDGVNNAEFVAHARTDVPALVAEVERLRRVVGHEVADDHIYREGDL